ncbi:MAG TPA: hypothetical protein VL996_00450, partial [Methylocella sp.]|nr:hypothetical protein [Methylocella sp.]
IFRPWTGIQVWLDEKRVEEKGIINIIDKLRSSTKSEPRDNNYHLYRRLPQLDIKAVGLSKFLSSLIGDDRFESFQAIKTELVEWAKTVDQILGQAQCQSDG